MEGSGAGGSVVRGPGAGWSGPGAAGGTTIQFADRTVTVFDAPTAVSVNVHTPVLVVDPDTEVRCRAEPATDRVTPSVHERATVPAEELPGVVQPTDSPASSKLKLPMNSPNR